MAPNKRLVLKKNPEGFPKPGEDLVIETAEVDLDAAPPKGGIITKNLFFSFDPYLRGRMRPATVKSYNPPFELGSTLQNWGVGKVLKSDSDKAQPGDIVALFIGSEEYSFVPAEALDRFDFVNVPKDNKLPLSYFCGVLGMPGRTAWSSLYKIGEPKKSETIWVSAAAGPVGQIVGQLAKHEGLRVIGSVGSDEKLEFITKTLGFDAGFNYKKEKPGEAIHRLAPEGIDIYYDNVGADHLEAALDAIKPFGRIVACGSIAGYNLNAADRYPIRNTDVVVGKRIKWQGFIVTDENMGPLYFKEHLEKLTKWLEDGSFKAQEDVTEGLDKAAAGFVGMLRGENYGKAVLKIADQ